MEYRSSNVAGWTHHQGDLVSNVNSSHGVQLSGGSTGGSVTAVGDDANVALTVKGKGTGPLILGSTGSTIRTGRPLANVGSTSAAATLGNVGGADGPGTEAQSGWLRILDSSGGAAYIAIWR